MDEIILTNKKKGMQTLLLCIALEILAVVGLIFGGEMLDKTNNPILFIPSIIVFVLAWIPLAGLKVLKPQEALVLTLFGKYIGTLKGAGFYAVNPFCQAINPAAYTK